jgi:hypothetical protein
MANRVFAKALDWLMQLKASTMGCEGPLASGGGGVETYTPLLAQPDNKDNVMAMHNFVVFIINY